MFQSLNSPNIVANKNKLKSVYSNVILKSDIFDLQGGEVVQETITSNTNDDLIILEFQKTDGTLITQLLDFRNVSYDILFSSKFILFLKLRIVNTLGTNTRSGEKKCFKFFTML